MNFQFKIEWLWWVPRGNSCGTHSKGAFVTDDSAYDVQIFKALFCQQVETGYWCGKGDFDPNLTVHVALQ
jgi:hypothetical protein